MKHVDLALRSFSESLAHVIRGGDWGRLREFLLGRSLPALGGDLPPAEIIRQAIFLHSDFRTLARGLATLLAEVVDYEVRDLLKRRATLDPVRRRLLLEVLALTSEISAHTDLFRALQELLAALRRLSGAKRESAAALHLPLWQALTYQQTDASLESEWLSLLRDSPEADWTPGRRTLLLIAWQGLLWIPPSKEMETAPEVVDFDRIERGLLDLAASVRGHEEAGDLLQEALEVLRDSFPRSSEFWEEGLRSRMVYWPEDLRESIIEVWPNLQSFFWLSPGTTECKPLSIYWRSLAHPQPGAESPLEALFTPETKGFWEDAGVKNSEAWTRKITKYLLSSHALRDLISPPREAASAWATGPEAVEMFAGSLLLHRLDPHPDLIRLAGATSLVCAYEDALSGHNAWKVLEAPPCLTHFAHEKADIGRLFPKTWALTFQQELAHQAVAALAQFVPVERQVEDFGAASRQIENLAIDLRRALVPEIASLLKNTMAGFDLPAALAQQAQQRSRIITIPGIEPLTAINLSFSGPAPEQYLRELAALSDEIKGAALVQLRAALQSAWNPLERLYLQAVTTLMALQEEDFLRALQELAALRIVSATVEHQVLKLHAKAGVGDRRSSLQIFKALEQKDLAEPVQQTLDLLNDAYGLSGRETAPGPEQHEEIIRHEAFMIEAASSLRPAA